MLERRVSCHQVKLAIVDATVILAPSHFGGIGIEVRASDMMMRSDLSAAQS